MIYFLPVCVVFLHFSQLPSYKPTWQNRVLGNVQSNKSNLDLWHVLMLWKTNVLLSLCSAANTFTLLCLLPHSYYLYVCILVVCKIIHTLSSLFIHTNWKSQLTLFLITWPTFSTHSVWYHTNLTSLPSHLLWLTHGIWVLALYLPLTSFVILEEPPSFSGFWCFHLYKRDRSVLEVTKSFVTVKLYY